MLRVEIVFVIALVASGPSCGELSVSGLIGSKKFVLLLSIAAQAVFWLILTIVGSCFRTEGSMIERVSSASESFLRRSNLFASSQHSVRL